MTGNREPGHVSSGGDETDWSDPRRTWDGRYQASGMLWSAEPNELFAQEVRDLRPGRALDLGCGEGRNALWLAENGWNVTAVDFSRVAVDRARRIAESKGLTVEWKTEDLLTYRPETGGLDLVLLIFIHLRRPDRERVLTGARDALAPGGSLVVVGHDALNLTEGVGGPQDPERLYSAADVVRMLPGLETVRAEAVRRPVSTGEGEQTAVDVVVRARAPEMK